MSEELKPCPYCGSTSTDDSCNSCWPRTVPTIHPTPTVAKIASEGAADLELFEKFGGVKAVQLWEEQLAENSRLQAALIEANKTIDVQHRLMVTAEKRGAEKAQAELEQAKADLKSETDHRVQYEAYLNDAAVVTSGDKYGSTGDEASASPRAAEAALWEAALCDALLGWRDKADAYFAAQAIDKAKEGA